MLFCSSKIRIFVNEPIKSQPNSELNPRPTADVARPRLFQGIGSLFSALKVVRLLRLGRVVRKLDRYLEYGAAMLILLLCFYMLVAHWLACIWYSIGRADADNGVQYSWLWKLANVTQSPYSYILSNDSQAPELINGPSRKTMYVTALYFTMTCMTSVGFGNVAAETDNEKIFTICMMIIAGEWTQRSTITLKSTSDACLYPMLVHG